MPHSLSLRQVWKPVLPSRRTSDNTQTVTRFALFTAAICTLPVLALLRGLTGTHCVRYVHLRTDTAAALESLLGVSLAPIEPGRTRASAVLALATSLLVRLCVSFQPA